MRWTSSAARVALAGSFLISISGCDKESPASPKSCFEAVEKGRQMLSVPDHDAAKGWLGRAKKDCQADQVTAVADLEKEIAASEIKVAEQKKKREESFKPKPAADSLVPGFVDAIAKYREMKKRETCDTDPCA